jgi:hypothetical protein
MLKTVAAALTLAMASAATLAQTAAVFPTVRLRGVIESVEPGSITLRERLGELITLVAPDNLSMNEVVPIALTDIKPGSFIGTAAMQLPDGTLEALEVLVFPESARGSNEGHYPWDLQPQSTMTNATVADLATVPQGRKLTLKYKTGEKVVIVPENVPVVTFAPGDKSLVIPGAKVIITATERDGKPTALRLLVGRNGFTPPM